MKRIALILLLLPGIAHATVTTQVFTVSYTCTGVRGPFAFTFPVSNSSAVVVTQNGSVLNPSFYTVVPVNNNYANGGSVTLNSPCLVGQSLALSRNTPVTQASVFVDNMPKPMKVIEQGLDKLTQIAQETDFWVDPLLATPQSPNLFLAGPSSGNPALPGFRSIAPTDLPAISQVLPSGACVGTGPSQVCTLPGTLTVPAINSTNLSTVNATTINAGTAGSKAYNVVAEGDSLTFSYFPSQGSYPYFLSNLTSFPVQNMGSDGNSSTGICIIQGACIAKTSAPLTMPTCASGCTGVTANFTPANPMSDPRGPMPVGAIVVSMTAVGGHVITGTFAVISGTPTFTPFSAAGETIAANTTLVVNTASRENGIQIIWAGRNDFPLASSPAVGNLTPAVQAGIVANDKAMACNNPFTMPTLVVGVTPITTPNEAGTSVEGGQLTTLKNTLSAGAGQTISCSQGYTRTYSFFDVWGYLQGLSSGDAVDTSDVANGYVPSSLHALVGNGTLNGGINNSVTSLTYTVVGGSNPGVGNILVIGSGGSEESMLISTVSCVGPSCSITVAGRGFGGTASSHSNSDPILAYDQTHFGPNANQNIATYVASWLTGSARVPVLGGMSSNALPVSATGVFAPTATCVPGGYTVNGGYAPCTALSAQYPPFIYNGVSSTNVPIAQFTPTAGGAVLQAGANGYSYSWLQSTINGVAGLLYLNPQGGETDTGGDLHVAGALQVAGKSPAYVAATATSLLACNNSGAFTACTTTTPAVSTGAIQGTNNSGYINVSAQTAVTLTFASPTGWASAAYCNALVDTAGAITVRGSNTGATSFTFTFSSSYSGGLYYNCGGK